MKVLGFDQIQIGVLFTRRGFIRFIAYEFKRSKFPVDKSL